MIYLDNAATTRVYESAIAAAENVMRNEYFNPNATYRCGVYAREAIENSRRIIADAAGTRADELYFTSCATESNNWALFCGAKNKKGNIVITAGEHSSVFSTAMQIKNSGMDVRIAPLNRDGSCNVPALLELTDANTTLVSIIHASNETGAVNDLASITEHIRARSPKALIHSDGVQAFIKLGESISSYGVDLYSASAHKLGAPKGIGLLYVRHGVSLRPYIHGGGQEKNMRSGTQNTPYIAAFAAAVSEYKKRANRAKIANLRAKTAHFFLQHDCEVVGNCQNTSGYILCVRIPGVKAEILQNSVFDRGIVIGKGAACSGSQRGNRVLSQMGYTQTEAEQCIRLSFFSDTAESDVMVAAQTIVQCAQTIRSNNVG